MPSEVGVAELVAGVCFGIRVAGIRFDLNAP
ncbi:hypothetical protein N798_08380 [Knoellia flava TL1]|nr:hypothetical protein N798_08380 [Knoellia flava TL1]